MEDVRHAQQHPSGWAGGDEWEDHRGRIQELYQGQNLSLKEVMRIMEERHGFRATQRMYKTRIKAWGLDKNFKESEVVELFRLRREREKLGKPTTYKIRGREIDWDRVNSYVKRKGLDIARLLEADRYQSPAVAREITCRTPSPISEHQHYHHEPSASTPSLSSSAGSDHYTHNIPPFTRPTTASSASIMAGMDPRTTNSTPYPAYKRSYSPTPAIPRPTVNVGHSATLPSLGRSLTIQSFQKFLTRIYETLLYEDDDKTWGTTQYWLGYSHALEWLMTIRYKAAFYRDILVQLSSDAGPNPNVSIAARDIVRRFRSFNRSFAMLEPMVQSVIGAKFYYFINFIHTFGLCMDVAKLPVAYPLVSIARTLLEETHNICSAPHPPPVLPGGFADGGRPGETGGGAYRRPSFSCNGVVNGGGGGGRPAATAAEQQEGFVSAAGYDADYYLLSHPPNLNMNSNSSSSSSGQPGHHHHHHYSDTSASASGSASRLLMLDSSSQDFKESAERFLNTVLEQTVKDLGVSQVPFESFLLLRETIDGRPILGHDALFPSSPMTANTNANNRGLFEVPAGVFNSSPAAYPPINHHPSSLPQQDEQQQQQQQQQQTSKKLLQNATSHLESAIWLLSHGKDAQAEPYLSSVITATETLLSASASSSISTSSLQPSPPHAHHPQSNPQTKSTSGSSEVPFPSVSLKVLLKNDSSSSSSWATKAAKVASRCAHYHLARLYGRRIRAGGGEGTGAGISAGTRERDMGREREREREHLIKSLEGTALFDEYVQWEEVEFLF